MQNISLSAIKKGLNKPLNLIVLDNVSSTMDYIKQEEGVFAVISKTQTCGRGTKGRDFCSEEGGIYLSAKLNVKIPVSNLSLITPYFATVVGGVLKSQNVPYSYKWVNDVFVNGKKLCGILTETVLQGEFVTKIIVGIGLNVNQKSFPISLSSHATSLLLEGFNIDINCLISSLLNKIANVESAFKTLDFISEYQTNSFVVGKAVALKQGENIIKGTALKIGDRGELIIKTETGKQSAFVGDLTLL